MFLNEPLPHRDDLIGEQPHAGNYLVPKESEERRPSGRSYKIKIATSIAVILCLIAGHALVITGSHGQPVKNWKVRPSVIVPMFSGIVHGLLAYLLSAGTAINWWDATRKGSTLEQLHQITNRGVILEWSKLRKFLFVDKNFSKVFLATCFIWLASLSAGPLLQKATSTTNSQFETQGVEKTFDILPEIPDGVAGRVRVQLYSAGLDFTASIRAWYLNDTMRVPNASGNTCDGRCRGLIRAPGISVDCERSQEIVDLRDPAQPGAYLFRVNTTLVESEKGKPTIDLVSIYSAAVTKNCMATVIQDKCKIHMAIADFPVIIEGNTIALEPQSIPDMNSPNRTYSAGDTLDAPNNALAGPLRGISYASHSFFESYTKVPISEFWETMGVPAETFYIYPNASSTEDIPIGCRLLWRSPTEWALNSMREIIFRVAINSNKQTNSTIRGNGVPVPQTFKTTQVTTELAFQSSYAWLAGGIAVEIIAVVLAVMLTWGWWDLTREVSLSPVETIQVMPHISHGGDRDVDDIIKTDGDMRVRYDLMPSSTV
jgi:hypothetical protein